METTPCYWIMAYNDENTKASQTQKCVVELTVDGESDGFFRTCVKESVLGQAGIVACVYTQDVGDGELWSRVDL